MSPRLAVTSAIRYAPHGGASGRLRILDLDAGRILLESEVPEAAYRAHDPNPRGGLRGARGIGFADKRFVLANFDRVFVFNREWRLTAELSGPLTAGIHDLLAESEGVWITCTGCDLLLRLDWEGAITDSWFWRQDGALAEGFGYRSLPGLRDRVDYRDPRHSGFAAPNVVAQLNGVARGRDGLIVMLGRVLTPAEYRRRVLRWRLAALGNATRVAAPAVRVARRYSRGRAIRGGLPAPDTGPGTCAVVQLTGNATGRSATVLMRRGGLRVPNHNVLETDDLLVYNDTDRGALATFDRRNGVRGPSVPVPGSPPYARGLAALGDATFVVGSQRPAAVHVVDLAKERVISSFVLGEDTRESVFGVAVVPDSFDDPPERLDFSLAESL